MIQLTSSTVKLTLLMFVAVALDLSAAQKGTQVENFVNLAEKMSDRQHQKYCERFGTSFAASQVDKNWPVVLKECIGMLVRNGTNLPPNFPKVGDDLRQKFIKMHDVCSLLVKNPCSDSDWSKVKKCIREEATNQELLSNQQGLPKNMPSISLALASSIFQCTERVLKEIA